jgi:cytochrome P450
MPGLFGILEAGWRFAGLSAPGVLAATGSRGDRTQMSDKILDQERCPFRAGPSGAVAAELDPFGAAYLADPFAVFARARREGRVFYSEELGQWLLTRYEDVKAVLRDTRRYSADIATRPLQPLSDEARAELARAGFRPRRVLVDNDPPDHVRIRRHVSKAFNARRLRLLEPDIRELARKHIAAFADEIDFVPALAWPLPALVIFRLFGVPDERLSLVKQGSRDRVTLQPRDWAYSSPTAGRSSPTGWPALAMTSPAT